MSKPIITILVAVSENNVIGNKNEIPWHIKEDLMRFRSLTNGKTIIVGRTTYELIKKAYEMRGKPMPDRKNIIITNNLSYTVTDANCFVVHSIEKAIQKAKKIEPEEVFIAGGASIYKLAFPYANKLDITVVHTTLSGDAFFPEYKSCFKNVISERDSSDENYSYTFFELVP
jgi:dihydrofolate reductase